MPKYICLGIIKINFRTKFNMRQAISINCKLMRRCSRTGLRQRYYYDNRLKYQRNIAIKIALKIKLLYSKTE